MEENRDRKTSKSGIASSCFLKGCIFISIAFIFIVSILIFKIFDGHKIVKEKYENFKILLNPLPADYQDYPDLNDLQSTTDYDVIKIIGTVRNFCVLEDGTSILSLYSNEFGCFVLYKISEYGQITDTLHTSKYFYGTTLMEYHVIQAPYIVKQNSNEQIGANSTESMLIGSYLTWPIDGDTMDREIEPISDILTPSLTLEKVCNEAEVILKVNSIYNQAYLSYLLSFENKWYFSKEIGNASPRRLDSYKIPPTRLYSNVNGLEHKHSQLVEYLREKQYINWMTASSKRKESWCYYIYMTLTLGESVIPFKLFTMVKGSDPREVEKTQIEIIKTDRYAVINESLKTYIIVLKE